MFIMKNEGYGRPTVMNEDLTQNFDVEIRQNSRFTIEELHQKFPQVSRSVVYQIVTGKLLHYKQVIGSGDMLKETVTNRLNGQAAELYIYVLVSHTIDVHK